MDLSQALVAVLKRSLIVQEAEALLKDGPGEGWLFTTPKGAMIHGNNFRDRVWKPLLRAAGVPYLWIHATRHTFASRMIIGGANIVYVQKQLGHSSIQLTVDTYTHWIQESERNATLAVDWLISHLTHNGCTLFCTSGESSLQPVEVNKEKWGE